MVDKKVNINAITFIDVIKYVLIYMKWCNYFFILFFIVSLLLLYIKVNIILYTLTTTYIVKFHGHSSVKFLQLNLEECPMKHK